jgi:hypothetical protein
MIPRLAANKRAPQQEARRKNITPTTNHAAKDPKFTQISIHAMPLSPARTKSTSISDYQYILMLSEN